MSLIASIRQASLVAGYRTMIPAASGEPARRGSDPFVGRRQRDPHVLTSAWSVELAGRNKDPAPGEPGDGVTTRLTARRPQIEPGLRVVDGQAGGAHRGKQSVAAARVPI